jgi:hypothetical protein
MRTVFIFGAGASRMAGGPLMSDFLDRAEELLRLRTEGVIEVETAFTDVFDALFELQGVHSKSFLDLNNIEVLFGAIEMALLIKKLGGRDFENINKLRNSLITLIYKTLEFTIPFPVRDSHIYPPNPYLIFIDILSNLVSVRRNKYHNDHYYSFMTFNYDLTLDYTLHHAGFNYDYCLTDTKPSGNLSYLKLHGSINWGICEECKQIVPRNINEAHFELWPHSESVFYNLGSTLSRTIHCGKNIEGPPVLIPPTWNKTGYHQQMGAIWKRAAEELSLADNIFVIGYSLPETDSFFVTFMH